MANYHIPGAFPDEKLSFTVPSIYQGRPMQTLRQQRYATTPNVAEDVYIAVMGVTGSGKSSFIQLCTQLDCGIGHKLKSQTQEVTEYSFIFNQGIRVHLIDTPGFDDSDRTDADVLRDIAGYLGTTYQKHIRLSGIIYTHRITDPRMQGSARRNFFMFRKLCGSDCYRQIALVTTCWSLVPIETGVVREAELIETEEFWGHMHKKGSKVLRHGKEDDRRSAMSILETLLRDRQDITLKIQREMKDGKGLEETEAGQQLNADIIKMREIHRREMLEHEQHLKEALRSKDEESAALLAELKAEVEKKIKAGEESQKKLKTDLETLQKDRDAAMQKLKEELEQSRIKWQDEQRRLQESRDLHKEDLQSLQEEHARTMEQLKKQMTEAAKKSAGSTFDWGSFASCVATVANVGWNIWSSQLDMDDMFQDAYHAGADDIAYTIWEAFN